MDGRRLGPVVCETYRDFAANTSIHGLRYTVRGGVGAVERGFWGAVVVAGVAGAAYMTVLFWGRYTSNPTRTSIRSDFAPLSSVPFPAVTICNINKVFYGKIQGFVQKLNISAEHLESVQRAVPQLLAYTDPRAKSYNFSELKILDDTLRKNDLVNVEKILEMVGQSCEELLVKCKWNFTEVPCGTIFRRSLTSSGHCCSFNYFRDFQEQAEDGWPMKMEYSGPRSGLVVVLDPMVQEVQYSALHTSGLKVVIHASKDYPGEDSTYKIVAAGRQSFLQISATKILCSKDIERLSVTHRDCVYPEEKSIKHFREYADSNCIIECEERKIRKRCKCVPFYYPFTAWPTCNITDIPCMDFASSTKQDSTICPCPPQCEDQFYNVLSTSSKIEYNHTLATSDFLADLQLNRDDIVLYVYFGRESHTILFRDTITSTIYLLSSFGGVYSLFLGCSFITIVEIIYYISFRLVVNLKIFAPINRKRPKVYPQEPPNIFLN